MRFKRYTKKQAKEIVENKNVAKYFNTYIEYTPAFKIRAVSQYLKKCMSQKEIFEKAGFDLAIFNKKKRSYLMYNWVQVFKAKGLAGLKNNGRGKIKNNLSIRPKIKIHESMTNEEKIKRLKLEVQYLKKENDFLVKLRAMQTE